MSGIYRSIEELIGGTPLLRLSHIEEAEGTKARILAKLESFNPAGSAKDRIAKRMIDDAEKAGLLRKGAAIIEPTSGNTGIGLAAIAAARGYRLIIVMPDTMSLERLVLTDGSKGMAGSIAKAKELQAEIPGSFIPDQFSNPSNPAAHYSTTGPEILRDTDGQLAALVASVGTGGTITGTGRFLKERIPGLRVIAVEPASSPVLSGGRPGRHSIQGIGAGFVPEALDTDVYDEIIRVSDEDAFATARMTGRLEGFLCGISSGAALRAAIEVAKRDGYSGKDIAVILPDGGDRYMSTELF